MRRGHVIGFLFGALLAVAASHRALAEEPAAEVGIVAADGTVQLHSDRFQERFPDGTLITSLSVTDSNGSLRVVRNGTGGPKICMRQSAPLLTSAGQPAVAGALQPGESVYLSAVIYTQLQTCRDSGCSANNNSLCKMTVHSDYKCRCHTRIVFWDDSSDVWVRDDKTLCDSIFEVTVDELIEWIRIFP